MAYARAPPPSNGCATRPAGLLLALSVLAGPAPLCPALDEQVRGRIVTAAAGIWAAAVVGAGVRAALSL